MTFEHLFPFLPTTLRIGRHSPGSPVLCAVEAVNEALGYAHGSDCPSCASRATEQLWEMLAYLCGVHEGRSGLELDTEQQLRLLRAVWDAPPCPEERGGNWRFVLVDLAVRVWTPRALEAAGMLEDAACLRALPSVVGPERLTVIDYAVSATRRLVLEHQEQVIGLKAIAQSAADMSWQIAQDMAHEGRGASADGVVALASAEMQGWMEQGRALCLWRQTKVSGWAVDALTAAAQAVRSASPQEAAVAAGVCACATVHAARTAAARPDFMTDGARCDGREAAQAMTSLILDDLEAALKPDAKPMRPSVVVACSILGQMPPCRPVSG